MPDKIYIKGANEHNLKNVDLEIPRDKLVVFTGLSGSGKSSLAFDTIYAEGQRRYMESLSSYARQFLGQMEKPDVEYIEGLSPAISIDQKTTNKNPRSTVGTVTEIHDYLRLLYARIGVPHCPVCGREISSQSVDQIVDSIMGMPEGTRVIVMAPVVRQRKGEHEKIIDRIRREGFTRVRIDGEMHQLEEDEIKLEKTFKHTIEI
ncbi:MAG: excinuclease ABC subunit UvrA, partial [Firmicutes bacterium]|nr:excinuclease ABC subunit UvrA [Bacillota bacterium]